MTSHHRLAWPEIVHQAAAIVRGYTTAVTLRQVFYRLVAAGTIPNRRTAYNRLSSLTAAARRAGTFPPLADRTRKIEQYQTFHGPEHGREWLARIYRRDRTEGQPFHVFVGVEKATLVAQLQAWFGDYGVPVVALRGYASQTLESAIERAQQLDGRESVLLYGWGQEYLGMPPVGGRVWLARVR